MENNSRKLIMNCITRFFLPALLFFLFYGCRPHVTALKEQNIASSYNPASSKFHPSFSVYHDKSNSSLLYIKLFPKEFLYSLANSEGAYKASVRVSYILLDITDQEKAEVADSAVITYNFKREGVNQRFIAPVEIAASTGRLYQLKIGVKDVVRNDEYIRYIYVDKRTVFSQQNFKVIDNTHEIPYFSPYVVGNREFTLESPNFQQFDSIFVLYYGQKMPLPKPSFSVSRETQFLARFDSMWVLPFRSGLSYRLSYEGMYFFQLDTSVNDGLTLMNFGSDFPKILTPEALAEPLAYLNTSVAYADLMNAKNKKLAVDDFWLKKTDNLERSRELIRIYYNRVYFSNYYFTTFKPGWMTDRGMIYIVYGPPQAIYQSVGSEKWVYYRKSFSTSLSFTFSYIHSPYSENNYVLQRSESYDTYWREAVDSWKKGRVFSFE